MLIADIISKFPQRSIEIDNTMYLFKRETFNPNSDTEGVIHCSYDADRIAKHYLGKPSEKTAYLKTSD